MLTSDNTTYIVTDVETTGSNPSKDRITEIACVTVRNGEMISQYSTLVNPHKEIPSYIAKMTGITQQMVSSAPEEFQVIDILVKIFKQDNAVFVAHNVSFDFGFVSNLFRRNTKKLELPQLCSLKLARKLLPRDVKKNVGDMSEYFGIHLRNRHRALIDAKATAISFIEMLHLAETEHKVQTLSEILAFQNKPVMNYKVPNEVTKRINLNFDEVPYQPGVFKCFDDDGKMIYWDFSFNLNTKIKSFFNSHHISSKFIFELSSKINKVDFQTTDSELSAMILRQQLIEESKSNLSLFEPYNGNDITESDYDFLYFQAVDHNTKAVDVYVIKAGKLLLQQSVGLKQNLEAISKRISDIYSQKNDNQIYNNELKVIRRWIDMQNDFGIIIKPESYDLEYISKALRTNILKAYEMTKRFDDEYEYY